MNAFLAGGSSGELYGLGRFSLSAAMQAFLRSRREREKGIKAEQRREREGFLASLDELQCDALGERVDCKPAEWAERGAAATQSG